MVWDTFSVSELREELFFKKLIIVYSGMDLKSMNASAKLHRLIDLRASRVNLILKLEHFPQVVIFYPIASELNSVTCISAKMCPSSVEFNFHLKRRKSYEFPF